MAAECPVYDNGFTILCEPTETGFNVSRFDGTTNNSYSVVPNLIECNPDIPQVLEMTALLTVILMAAFGIQMMKRPIR